MKKFPIKKITLDVEALGGAITLTELTTEYRDLTNDDRTFDTPKNALMNAGLSEEDFLKLGEQIAYAIYEELIELTYPNIKEEVQKLIDEGAYVPLTNEEEIVAKKN